MTIFHYFSVQIDNFRSKLSNSSWNTIYYCFQIPAWSRLYERWIALFMFFEFNIAGACHYFWRLSVAVIDITIWGRALSTFRKTDPIVDLLNLTWKFEDVSVQQNRFLWIMMMINFQAISKMSISKNKVVTLSFESYNFNRPHCFTRAYVF